MHREIGSVDSLEGEITGQKNAAQQTDQNGQTESASNPTGHAEDEQSAQPEGSSRLPAPGDTDLAQEVGQSEMDENRPFKQARRAKT